MSGTGFLPGYEGRCGLLFPTLVNQPTKMNGERLGPVQCNRPYGHEGHCNYSNSRAARIYEWSAGVIVRSP